MFKTLLQLKPRDVPPIVALRNTVAVALPLALGLATDHLGIGLGISVGALNTMFSDQPGPYRLRMRRMLFAAFAAGISAFVGYTVGDSNVLVAIAALIWGLCGGILVALGPDAGRIGLTSMILLVITAADPRPPEEAIARSALFCSGGLLLTLLAIAAWPLQRYRPERFALAQLCRELAASARRRDDSSQPPPVTQAVTDVEHLLHGAYRARGSAMEALRVLAEIIERIRLELLALGVLDERSDHLAIQSTLRRLREYAARTLDSLAGALEAGAAPLAASGALEGFDAALKALPQHDHLSAQEQRLIAIAMAHGRALGGQLRAALRNANFAGSLGELRLAADDARLPSELRARNPLAILRANITLSSVACRHAIRCAVCLAIAVVGERIAGIPHGYWIPMTTAIVLKPDFAGTFSFGLLRVIGTLLGLALTTALLHFAFGGDWPRVILFALFCYGFRMFTTMHYAVGVMLLTSLIVILLSFEGLAPGDTMTARAIGTSLGSALALFAYIVWPTWENRRIRPALAEMVDAYRKYFLAVLDDAPRVRTDVRRAARSARTNAQASLDRLRNEPHRDRREVVVAEGIFANANRFIRAAMSLEAIRQHEGPIPAHEEIRSFAETANTNALSIVEYLRNSKPMDTGATTLRDAQTRLREALRRDHAHETDIQSAAWIDASDRITDSVDTLAHVLRDSRQ
ncbi:MAG: FUSC family protein [Rudaea sp.]